MICLKKIIKKFDKYIEDKNRRKFKKLEARVLNNATSTSISKILKATKKLLKKLVY